MISLLAAFFGLLVVGLLFRSNRAAFVAGFFILFSLIYRIVDILYLDLFGPTFAIELGRYVGGNIATPMFVLCCFAFLVPLWIVYRPAAMARKLGAQLPDLPYYASLRRWAFPGCAGFIGLVYLDMLRKGTIPLLVGMDRLDYNVIAGVLHNPLYELSFILTTTLGIFTVLPRLQGGRFDLRFAILFLAILFYWILTGNRFSIFYREISFFLLPFAAVLAMEAHGKLAKISRRDAWSAIVSSRVVVPMAAVLAAGTLTGLLINNFYDVRNYADPLFQMTQRAFVQPVQFWDVTWAHTDFARDLTPSRDALRQVFVNPINPDGNTTIQYLMSRELGYFRAARLIGFGQQYAGGYPEIFFDLFGPWIGLVLIVLLGVVSALLLRLSTVALTQGKLFTSLMAVYVYFGFSLTYIGGMLNFVLAPSFAAKIIILLLAMYLEGAVVANVQRPRGTARPPRRSLARQFGPLPGNAGKGGQ